MLHLPLRFKTPTAHCWRLVNGDVNLEMEITAALSEKRENFKNGDLTCVQEVLKHHAAANADALRAESNARNVAAGELEKEEYHLVCNQIL